ISEDVFRASLTDLLISRIQDKSITEPIALYPVRPPPANPDYVEPAPERPWSAEDGSEHIVANIITEVVKACRTVRRVSASASIEKLRTDKVRTIILVDDYIGSGTAALAYLDRWWANRTIKSWRSFGLIRVILVTYACSVVGRKRLTHRLLDDLLWIEFGVDFTSAQWGPEERDTIRALCAKYARKRSLALGYKDSEGLLVMSHTVPNNLPQIFRNGISRHGPWVSFSLQDRGEYLQPNSSG